MSGTPQYERAKARVMRSPRLRPLADIILHDYGGRHYIWVEFALVRDILKWAQEIQSQCGEVSQCD